MGMQVLGTQVIGGYGQVCYQGEEPGGTNDSGFCQKNGNATGEYLLPKE